MNIEFYRHGAGGYCTAGGVLEYGSPPTAIAAPGAVVNRLLAGIAATMTGAGAPVIRGGGGGGGSSGGVITQCCSVFIGRVVEAPAGGYGAGRVAKITFNTDGTWTSDDDSLHTVIFPRI